MLTRSFHRWLVLAVVLMAPGCHRYLIDTPNLLKRQDPDRAYAACPDGCRMSAVPVLYATDRSVETKSGASPTYGYGRARSLGFGVANVRLDPEPSWRELTTESTLPKRTRDFELKLGEVSELGRFKQSCGALGETGVITQASTFPAIQEREKLDELLRTRLALTSHKDVYIFVHGFNSSFDDAVFRAAEVWHFMGRVGVPIAYTWPAGYGGIRGYAYDRESGEFTVTHLRHFIKAVAECPEVERVHLVAHSRGCDVMISALRELHIEQRAAGKNTQKQLKLENVVLAAPDVDEEVFMQRFVGENVLQAAKRTTIYASPHDKAIELSDLVFASRRRLGAFAFKDFSPKVRHALANQPNVQFIECKVSGVWMSHNYSFTHPAALSDLILVLRDRRDPGIEHGRPLVQPAAGIWELTDDYLK